MAHTQIDWLIVLRLLEKQLQDADMTGFAVVRLGAGEAEPDNGTVAVVRFVSFASDELPGRIAAGDAHQERWRASIAISLQTRDAANAGAWEPMRIAAAVQRVFRGIELRDATTSHFVKVMSSGVEYDFGVGDGRSESLVVVLVQLSGIVHRDAGDTITTGAPLPP
jgi:hypothetical protein